MRKVTLVRVHVKEVRGDDTNNVVMRWQLKSEMCLDTQFNYRQFALDKVEQLWCVCVFCTLNMNEFAQRAVEWLWGAMKYKMFSQEINSGN